MDKLTALSVFRRVVDLGSFAAAAEDLNLSPAAVSKHVAALEASLGVRLLQRTTRRLSLTEVGRLYHAGGARILDDLSDLDAQVRRDRALPCGTLRVNAPMAYGLTHLAPLLPEFLARYPEIRLDLVMSDRFVDLLEEGFDLGLRIRSGPPDSSLVGRSLARIDRVVCAAPSYFEQRGVPRRPEDLKDHDCLIYTLATNPGQWRFNDPAAPGGRVDLPVTGRLSVNNSMVAVPMLIAGLGIAQIPVFMVEDALASGALVTALDAFQPPPHDLYALYPSARHLSVKVRVFVDYLADKLGRAPEPARRAPVQA